MGFFDAFQQWAGENRAKRLRPIEQMKNEVQLELERRQAIAKQLHEQSFRDIAAELEKKRAQAESFAKNPDQLLSVTEHVPSWNEADELMLDDAYQRSGIDRKKQAEADQAVLAADAFKRGLANITNEAALVNIGMGKDYKPVELEGGVFYNPYDTRNFNLGSTEKHKAETKLKQSEAAEQALRLARIQALQDPLMQINATSNKELGKPVEVIIEGENGESNIVLASQDSSGKYRPQVLADTATGKPLVIPPEASGQGLTSEQINIQNRARLLKISEAEALSQMIHSKTDSPEATFNNLYDVNRNDDTNMERDPKERLQKTMMEFAILYPDLPIPGIEARIKRTISDEKDQAELLTLAQQLNSNLPVNPPPPQPEIVNQAVNQPPAGVTPPQGGSSAPVLDNLMNQWQAGQQQAPGLTLDQPPAAMPEPLPTAPAPMPEPLPTAPAPMPEPALSVEPQPFDLNKTIAIASQHTNPADIRKAMAAEGMAVDDKSLGSYLITAINTGKADPADMNFLAQLLGIDLKL